MNVVMVQYGVKEDNKTHSPELVIKESVLKIEKLLSTLFNNKDKVDFIVFPELSLTPYLFENPEQAMRYECENQSIQFAIGLSKRLKDCYVAIGFIRKNKQGKLFNSLACVKGDSVIHRQDKTFLYDSDRLWASSLEATNENNKEIFPSIVINNKKFVFAICMDINSENFEKMEEHPLATAVLEKDADVIIFLSR